ncbi:hypothetical protein [Microcella sp.]|uniref:hypothetical protein n=1 Tax=Microcella sp. TaxID=1913979 RepID=UPI00256CB3AC|nr:hypothetical protein [Microcella sp.]MBX9471052.1 hypothetical protein [Microcella sp.]
MSMNDHTSGTHDDDLTQGENPGAQGDIGAGQAEPGPSDPVVVGDGVVEGDEQPRREEHLDGDSDDELISPLDRDPGEDSTMINGGNSDR